jgi:hypothetical protein
VETDGIYKGVKFSGAGELKNIILRYDKIFARNLTVKISEYIKGRSISSKDHEAVDAIILEAEKGGYLLKDLVRSICVSDVIKRR